MHVLINQWGRSFYSVYIYQIITLYIKCHNIICQLHLSEAGKNNYFLLWKALSPNFLFMLHTILGLPLYIGEKSETQGK